MLVTPSQTGKQDAVSGETEGPHGDNADIEFLGDEQQHQQQSDEVSFFSSHLRCDQPESLRGRVLMQMEPHRFCDAPLILKMAIQDVQPYAVHVSWNTREQSGLHGYHVVYRTVDTAPGESDEVIPIPLVNVSVAPSDCTGRVLPN